MSDLNEFEEKMKKTISVYEQNFLQKMPDGTVKQVNPFTGTQVWTVPGRGKRPTVNKKADEEKSFHS